MNQRRGYWENSWTHNICLDLTREDFRFNAFSLVKRLVDYGQLECKKIVLLLSMREMWMSLLGKRSDEDQYWFMVFPCLDWQMEIGGQLEPHQEGSFEALKVHTMDHQIIYLVELWVFMLGAVLFDQILCWNLNLFKLKKDWSGFLYVWFIVLGVLLAIILMLGFRFHSEKMCCFLIFEQPAGIPCEGIMKVMPFLCHRIIMVASTMGHLKDISMNKDDIYKEEKRKED